MSRWGGALSATSTSRSPVPISLSSPARARSGSQEITQWRKAFTRRLAGPRWLRSFGRGGGV